MAERSRADAHPPAARLKSRHGVARARLLSNTRERERELGGDRLVVVAQHGVPSPVLRTAYRSTPGMETSSSTRDASGRRARLRRAAGDGGHSAPSLARGVQRRDALARGDRLEAIRRSEGARGSGLTRRRSSRRFETGAGDFFAWATRRAHGQPTAAMSGFVAEPATTRRRSCDDARSTRSTDEDKSLPVRARLRFARLTTPADLRLSADALDDALSAFLLTAPFTLATLFVPAHLLDELAKEMRHMSPDQVDDCAVPRSGARATLVVKSKALRAIRTPASGAHDVPAENGEAQRRVRACASHTGAPHPLRGRAAQAGARPRRRSRPRDLRRR